MKTCSCGTAGEENFNKNATAPDGLAYQCKACVKAYYQRNKARFIEKAAQWKEGNKEKVKQYAKRHRERNKDKRKQYYTGNKEALLEYGRNYRVEYYKRNRDAILARTATTRKNNPARYCSYARKHQTAKIKRTPKWLTNVDFDRIRLFYEAARSMTNLGMEKFSVDHIVPLQGKLVSGLHVPWNLQVITVPANSSKNNSYVFDQK